MKQSFRANCDIFPSVYVSRKYCNVTFTLRLKVTIHDYRGHMGDFQVLHTV